MERVTLNLSEAVTFDLSVGRVNLRETYPQVLLPAEGLKELCAAAGDAATQVLGKVMGKQMGERIAKRLTEQSSTIEKVSAEEFLANLRAEFALAGFGSLSIERWGKALLLVLDHGQAPLALAGEALGAAIEQVAGKEVRAVHMMTDGPRDRFLLANPKAAEQVTSWLQQAVSWGEVLVRLHTSAKQ